MKRHEVIILEELGKIVVSFRLGFDMCCEWYKLAWPARRTPPLLFIMLSFIVEGEGSSNSC